MGEEGFSSDCSLLYRRGVPSAMVDARIWELPDLGTVPNHPLMPRHLKLHELFPGEEPGRGVDAVTGRRLILGNGDVRISYAVCAEPSPLYRNAIGDECGYVEAGAATVETVFGALPARAGDYVILPRATVHRWVPDTSAGPLRLYVIEGNSHIGPPKRYLSKFGQLLEHSPYCERDLHGPEAPLLVDGTDVEVYTKHRGNGPSGIVGSIVVNPTHPFDVVGWDGCLYPYTFNVSDFEPITGRVHQPPPVHQVFEGWNFVVCNFVPRKVDYHPLSIPVPYYHANVDSDEIMFYVDGDYEARKGSGIGKGSGVGAPRRPFARSTARRGRSVAGQALLRRAGRHGGHVPAAGARRGRPGGGRRPVRVVLVRPRAGQRRRLRPGPGSVVQPSAG